jgi:hypothetical protein
LQLKLHPNNPTTGEVDVAFVNNGVIRVVSIGTLSTSEPAITQAQFIETLHQSGVQAHQNLDSIYKNELLAFASEVAGGLISSGIEAIQAARAARAAKEAVDLLNITEKIKNQMAQGGWTDQGILNMVENGNQYRVPNLKTGGPATEYYSPLSKKFVVIDNTTREIIQVSRPGMLPNHLVR